MYPKWTFFQIGGVFPIENVSQKPRFKSFGMFGHAPHINQQKAVQVHLHGFAFSDKLPVTDQEVYSLSLIGWYSTLG